jgi:hypothetical protein
MERNLKKLREVSLYTDLTYKNRSQILHICYSFRITSGILKPIFHNFASLKAGNELNMSSLFVTVSILGNGLQFKVVICKGPLELYVSWYESREGLVGKNNVDNDY